MVEGWEYLDGRDVGTRFRERVSKLGRLQGKRYEREGWFD